MLEKKQKLYIVLIALAVLALAMAPKYIGEHLFVVDNVITNDMSVCIISPVLTISLFLLLPLLSVKVFPVLSGLDLTWTRKPRAKIRWYILLVLSPVIIGAIVRFISERTGYPIMNILTYRDVTELSLTFFLVKVLFSVILTPIAEEIFFRGFLQDQFSKCFGWKTSLFLQAFLFELHLTLRH